MENCPVTNVMMPFICTSNAFCTNGIAIPGVTSTDSCYEQCLSMHGANVFSYNANNNTDCRCAGSDSCVTTTAAPNGTYNVFTNNDQVSLYLIFADYSYYINLYNK